jgi:hypothetical protein
MCHQPFTYVPPDLTRDHRGNPGTFLAPVLQGKQAIIRQPLSVPAGRKGAKDAAFLS